MLRARLIKNDPRRRASDGFKSVECACPWSGSVFWGITRGVC